MLTTPGRSGYRALTLVSLLAVFLGGCSARPVLHEFPPMLAPAARPAAAVSYTLRVNEAQSGGWTLRGEQGDMVGGFRWQPAFQEATGSAADFQRDDVFQDGINGANYRFRVSATDDRLRESMSRGFAPRVTIFNLSTGERVGELDLRTGFDLRFEGDWRGRHILWRAESVPEMQAERDTDDGTVEDFSPAAQLLQWVSGSNAGLRIYSGRAVSGEPPAFAEPLFDIQAGRPLTRRELGDTVTLLFAVRALEELAVRANTLGEM